MHRPHALPALVLAAGLAATAPTAAAQQGPFVHPQTGTRYYLTPTASWNFAVAYSMARWRAAPAAVQDPELNEWLRTTVANAGGNTLPCFIGFTDAGHEGTFTWINDERTRFANWAPGEPNGGPAQNYAALSPIDGLWTDVASAALPAIVEATGPIRVPEEFPTIQDAVNAAIPGQTILVGPGVYPGAIDLGYKSLTIRSEAGAFNTTLWIPTGEAGITIRGGQGPETVLEGFAVIPMPGATVLRLVHTDGAPTIRNCRLSNPGLTAFDISGPATVSDCLIAECGLAFNVAPSGRPMEVVIQNCTIAGNFFGIQVGDGERIATSVRLVNSATAGNTIPFAAVGTSNLFFHSNVVAEGPVGPSNLNADPGFSGAPGPDGVYGFYDDYSLAQGSPCIDAGNNARRRPLADSSPATDLGGSPRFVDIPEVVNTGAGPGAVVDVGAYEFSPPAAPSCPIDFNHDGFVDFFDYDDFVAAFESGC